MERSAMSISQRTTAPQTTVASTLNLLLGVWLFIAGFLLTATAAGRWNDVIVGVLVFIFASWRLSRPTNVAPTWLNFLLGIWLLFAPKALNYTSVSARWNDFAVGCAVIILAIVSASARQRVPRSIADVDATEHRRAA